MSTPLSALVARLKHGAVVPLPPTEQWAEMIARTTSPGAICEVAEDTYDYFLDVLPPRWMGAGFAFGEGADHLRLFWRSGGRFFCRQLDADEHAEFCRLANIGLSSG